MKISDFKTVSFVNFSNVQLDFTNNYYNVVDFEYKDTKYSWYVIQDINGDLYLQDDGMVVKAEPDKVLRHRELNFCLSKEDFSGNNNDFNKDTIFTKYKIGILSYV